MVDEDDNPVENQRITWQNATDAAPLRCKGPASIFDTARVVRLPKLRLLGHGRKPKDAQAPKERCD